MHHLAYIVSSLSLTHCFLSQTRSICLSPKPTYIYNTQANKRKRMEQENQERREQIANLRADLKEMTTQMAQLMVARSQLPPPPLSTQDQMLVSSMPISTVFASTPQQTMLEGYLWSTF